MPVLIFIFLLSVCVHVRTCEDGNLLKTESILTNYDVKYLNELNLIIKKVTGKNKELFSKCHFSTNKMLKISSYNDYSLLH